MVNGRLGQDEAPAAPALWGSEEGADGRRSPWGPHAVPWAWGRPRWELPHPPATAPQTHLEPADPPGARRARSCCTSSASRRSSAGSCGKGCSCSCRARRAAGPDGGAELCAPLSPRRTAPARPPSELFPEGRTGRLDGGRGNRLGSSGLSPWAPGLRCPQRASKEPHGDTTLRGGLGAIV